MPVGNVEASIAAQQEFLRDKLETMMGFDSVLWSEIKTRTDVKPVSNRPSRIPFQTAAAGNIRTANLDGGALGRGTGPQETPGYLSCVAFSKAIEYTALAEYSTNSDEKAIKNYVTLTMEQATKTMSASLDAMISTGDGSNKLDSVVSTVAGGLVVTNANFFQDGQTVDVWSTYNPGATSRGSVTISSVDIANNTIWLTGGIGTIVANDLIFVQGSSAVLNSGLAGILAYNAGGNTGTYMQISKAAFPGKFSTPFISVGGSLTPAVVNALNANQQLAMGIDNDGRSQVAHCNVDMQAAWLNTSLNVQSVIVNQVPGDSGVDMLKKKPTQTIAGRRIMANIRAIPGRIDFLDLKSWFRIETKALDFYGVGGTTLFPAYDGDGGIATSMLSYLVIMCQIGNGQPRKQAYLSNVTKPANIFAA